MSLPIHPKYVLALSISPRRSSKFTCRNSTLEKKYKWRSALLKKNTRGGGAPLRCAPPYFDHCPVTCCLMITGPNFWYRNVALCELSYGPDTTARSPAAARYLPEPTMSRAKRPTRSEPTVDRSARWAPAPGQTREHVLSAPRRPDHPGAVPTESVAVGHTHGRPGTRRTAKRSAS